MNQKTLLIAIATLIVAIFAFAQVYIIFTVTTINDRINSVDQQLTRLETRMDQRFTAIDQRLQTLKPALISDLQTLRPTLTSGLI